ncbi:MAG: ABC transporter permease [Thermoanaerobaculia bacterium]|nr:ABC transporter permease [Thermoanaerobaculia bacterium]
MSWFRRLKNFLRPDRIARDIDRELEFHLEERMDELVSSGWSEREARREARRRFGHRAEWREQTYDIEVLPGLDMLRSDVKYALRAMRRSPGFTAVAIVSLALGIGANTAIFSLIDAVMLRPLPVDRPEQLVQIVMENNRTAFTNPIWEQVRDGQEILDGAFAFADTSFDLGDGGVVRYAPGTWVSGDYFEVLGITPAAGRLLGRSDDIRGCAARAVLGHDFWQREFGGDKEVVGRPLSLQGLSFEVVGVAQPGFRGIHVGRRADVFAPLCSIASVRSPEILDARSSWFLNVFGRLGETTGFEQASAGVAAFAPSVYAATVPQDWSADEQAEYRQGVLQLTQASTGISYLRGRYRQALIVLWVVVGAVLLITCANVAQLLLARAVARQQEVAMRLALGSGRRRLVRQLLTESLLLALLGAGAGILFARWSSQALVSWLSYSRQPVALDLVLDARILGFTIAVTALTGILFGLAPAWRSTRVEPQDALRGAGRDAVAGSGTSRLGTSQGIVVVQVALSLVLVTAAVLLAGSFGRLASLDPGFEAEGVLLFEADWSRIDMDEERQREFRQQMLRRVRAIPGVRHASASLVTPIGGISWNEYIEVDGFAPRDERDSLAWFNGVTEGYLEALGTALVAGRDLSSSDRHGAPPVALVNQTLVETFFGGESPLNRSLRIRDHDQVGEPIEIVGVVEDAKYRRLDEETLPTVYRPLDQSESWGSSVHLELSTGGPAEDLIGPVTEAMQAVHPALRFEFTSMREQVASSLARPRLLATLSGFFALLALMLSVIGLFGVISFGINRRRKEIGVRVALGAGRAGILRLVGEEVARLVGLGVGLGVLLALVAVRLIDSFLYGVTARDPATFLFSAILLSAVALAAGILPAWRASGTDPMLALRDE